jgi:hypothetical protein
VRGEGGDLLTYSEAGLWDGPVLSEHLRKRYGKRGRHCLRFSRNAGRIAVHGVEFATTPVLCISIFLRDAPKYCVPDYVLDFQAVVDGWSLVRHSSFYRFRE